MSKDSMFGIKIQANTLIYRLLGVIIPHKSRDPILISALFYLSRHKHTPVNIVYNLFVLTVSCLKKQIKDLGCVILENKVTASPNKPSGHSKLLIRGSQGPNLLPSL